MENTQAVAKAEKPNYITLLNNEQADTLELLGILSNRLSVVVENEPQDDAEVAPSSVDHISRNFTAQRSINSQLRYILRTLVI